MARRTRSRTLDRPPAWAMGAEALYRHLLAEHFGPWPGDRCDQDDQATHREDHQTGRLRVRHRHRGRA
jgi:hypothetical protein